LIFVFNRTYRGCWGWLVAAGLAGGLTCSVVAQQPAAPVVPNPTVPLRHPGESRFVVVLDAAHGGDDSGGQVGASVPEKTVTLALSVRLRSLLTARGFTVVTTREGNVNLASDARAQIANHATSAGGGSACLSLHASEAGSGVHIYVSSLAPAQGTRFVAWKTAQSEFVIRSLKLAGTVNSAFEHSSVGVGGDSAGTGGDAGAGPIPATLARASLPGVDSMTCPAVAIELAPTRGADRKVVTEVTDPQYQTQFVEALAAAMLEWKTDLETDSHAGGRLP
jgi:N-acetylmuramoyl-L-alanine amidase